jgi:hypothetical protein
MPRSLPAAALAAAVLFAACASSPPPLPPLALGERFDVVYDGRVGVLPPMDPAVAEATSALAALNGSTADAKAAATDDAGTGTAAVRLWLIELPADDPDARALADGAAVKAARPIHARGVHSTPKALVERIESWHDRANVVSARRRCCASASSAPRSRGCACSRRPACSPSIRRSTPTNTARASKCASSATAKATA